VARGNIRNRSIPAAFCPLALAALALAVACLPTAGTTRPSWATGKPDAAEAGGTTGRHFVFEPCSMRTDANPARRSFAALVISLKEQKWSIARLAPQQDTVDASICYRDDPSWCVWVSFRSDPEGRVIAWPGTTPEKLEDDLGRWFVALERSFSNSKCYTDAVLGEEMGKYGIPF
jgi:hypothetical protein